MIFVISGCADVIVYYMFVISGCADVIVYYMFVISGCADVIVYYMFYIMSSQDVISLVYNIYLSVYGFIFYSVSPQIPFEYNLLWNNRNVIGRNIKVYIKNKLKSWLT